MRTIDITKRDQPVMVSIDGGAPAASGPVDIVAMADVRHRCARCTVQTARYDRRVRVTSEGQWKGTVVADAETGAAIPLVLSVLITVPDQGEATALVLARHGNEKGAVLCSTCSPARPR